MAKGKKFTEVSIAEIERKLNETLEREANKRGMTAKEVIKNALDRLSPASKKGTDRKLH